jgi:hypothetical protein
MVLKILKSNLLMLNYQLLSEEGRLLSRRQSFDFLPLESSDDDLYSMGKSIGDFLLVPPKSIEKNTVYTLTEG